MLEMEEFWDVQVDEVWMLSPGMLSAGAPCFKGLGTCVGSFLLLAPQGSSHGCLLALACASWSSPCNKIISQCLTIEMER